MATQREQRIRRPRKVFSPSDSFLRSTHYLLYFDATDSYHIALSSSVGNISGTTATLYIRGKKRFASIITSGSLHTCEDEQKKRTREFQQNEIEDQDEALSHSEDENVNMVPPSQQENSIHEFSASNLEQVPRTSHRVYSVPNVDIVPDSISYNDENDENDEEENHQFDRSSRRIGQSNSNKKSAVPKKNEKTIEKKPEQRNDNESKLHTVSQNNDDEQLNRYVSSDMNNEINSTSE
ncbi:unnamed protein product [Rotaria magnacalcarata]|uniref:Uncharacterized protein n=1 Tax=Rotaria magnacalcarata TaxID=392030 RepID=A0A820D5L3_9BILA|nr:unnamed protein product [Rotaria magnacalcarata]